MIKSLKTFICIAIDSSAYCCVLPMCPVLAVWHVVIGAMLQYCITVCPLSMFSLYPGLQVFHVSSMCRVVPLYAGLQVWSSVCRDSCVADVCWVASVSCVVTRQCVLFCKCILGFQCFKCRQCVQCMLGCQCFMCRKCVLWDQCIL
jgi:hypothetical protein